MALKYSLLLYNMVLIGWWFCILCSLFVKDRNKFGILVNTFLKIF